MACRGFGLWPVSRPVPPRTLAAYRASSSASNQMLSNQLGWQRQEPSTRRVAVRDLVSSMRHCESRWTCGSFTPKGSLPLTRFEHASSRRFSAFRQSSSVRPAIRLTTPSPSHAVQERGCLQVLWFAHAVSWLASWSRSFLLQRFQH